MAPKHRIGTQKTTPVHRADRSKNYVTRSTFACPKRVWHGADLQERGNIETLQVLDFIWYDLDSLPIYP
jgi:hypothetical protein